MKLHQQVQEVLLQLKNHQIEAYVVGGYIRDLLLNKESFDVDICFVGEPQDVMNILSQYEFDLSAQKYGTLSFKSGDYQFECTHLRIEEGSSNHRHPDRIEWTSILQEDLKRRDFTINTLCYHLDEGLIDLYGGVKDLKAGILKTVGDPVRRFDEDYLRVFRCLRFSSHLGFRIDESTEKAMISVFPLLKDYPVVWWQDEFEKFLLGTHFLEVSMQVPDFFDSLFGYFKEAFIFDQRNPYHDASLYHHTMRVVDALPKDRRLRIAGLFHDLGKLSTEEHDDEGISHYRGHAEASYILSRPILDRFTMKLKDKEYILKLIRYHGIQMNPGFSTVNQLSFEYGYDFIKDLIVIKRADNLAKAPKAHYQVLKCDAFDGDMARIIEEKWPLQVQDLLVGAKDCIALGLPRERIGEVLKSTLNEVVSSECGSDYKAQFKILEGVLTHVVY